MSLASADRKRLMKLKNRQGRKKSSDFICEGWRCCRELITAKPQWIDRVYYHDELDEPLISDCRSLNITPVKLEYGEFKEISQTDHPQGILILGHHLDETNEQLNAPLMTLVLSGISDPGNLGTICRSAWAVGNVQLIMIKGCCDLFEAKAIRAGMGAQFNICLTQLDGVEDCFKYAEDRHINTIYFTHVEGGEMLYDDSLHLQNTMVVMGNETSGLAVDERAIRLHIPMPGKSESLNVAQAANLILFETLRRSL
ncbi:RNA methyltransferase [bacterium AH-315-E10]|nr:RNA methyltransferase [bacterium AH-315-E10]